MINIFQNNREGFTLVELSIVLIIIGLIVSGVLIGQDLIRSAENRAILTQIDKLNVGVNAFRAKYGALPGDFNRASTFLPSTTFNGDGNGVLHEAVGAPLAAATTLSGANNEIPHIFNHLTRAGLIEGNFSSDNTSIVLDVNFPTLKNNKGGIIAYGFTDFNNYWHLGLTSSSSATITTANALSPSASFQIDSKMDDGRANSGFIQAKGGVTLEGVASAGAVSDGTSCVVTGGENYNVANQETILCQLRVRFF